MSTKKSNSKPGSAFSSIVLLGVMVSGGTEREGAAEALRVLKRTLMLSEISSFGHRRKGVVPGPIVAVHLTDQTGNKTQPGQTGRSRRRKKEGDDTLTQGSQQKKRNARQRAAGPKKKGRRKP